MDKMIIVLTKQLIAIHSTADQKESLHEALNVAMQSLRGHRYVRYEKDGIPSIVFYNTPTFPKKFTVILNAHLDVVPAVNDLFTPRIHGNRLYGRGAYDMKAAAATEICLFNNLAKTISFPLGLQLVTDEEIGGFCGAQYQKKQGVDATCMIVGETSSNFSIGAYSKGIIWMTITFTGKSAHAAYLWKGKNACSELNTFLNKLWCAFPIPEKELWKTTVNVARISTPNTTNNKVPDSACVQLDIRYIPDDKDQIVQTIRSLLPKSAKVDITENEPARSIHKDDPFVLRFKNIAQHILNRDVSVVGKAHGTDLRHYPQTVGLEFGPTGNGPHEDNEWVDILSLSQFYDILRAFLLSLSTK